MERLRRGRESELDRLCRGYTDIPVLSDCSLAYVYVCVYVGTYVLSMCACPRYNASYQFWPVFLGSDLLIGRVVSVAMVMAPELPQAVLAKIQGTVQQWKCVFMVVLP